MALVLKKLYKMYFYLDNDIVDPQTRHSLFTSPIFFIGFLTSYVFIVKRMGPRLMENRKPFNIKNFIIVYNIFQIFVNITIMYMCFVVVKSSPYIICVQSPLKDLLLLCRNYFFALKLLDCVETVFFVLRKSYRQISFLHVYHHCGMVFAGWVAHKYDVGDATMHIGILNCFIHAVMFVYYLLSTIDPKWKNNLTMKKTLTALQLMQFLIFVCIFTSTSVIPDCKGFPTILGYAFVIQNSFMLFLFGDFYIKTYLKKDKTKIRSG